MLYTCELELQSAQNEKNFKLIFLISLDKIIQSRTPPNSVYQIIIHDIKPVANLLTEGTWENNIKILFYNFIKVRHQPINTLVSTSHEATSGRPTIFEGVFIIR